MSGKEASNEIFKSRRWGNALMLLKCNEGRGVARGCTQEFFEGGFLYGH